MHQNVLHNINYHLANSIKNNDKKLMNIYIPKKNTTLYSEKMDNCSFCLHCLTFLISIVIFEVQEKTLSLYCDPSVYHHKTKWFMHVNFIVIGFTTCTYPMRI